MLPDPNDWFVSAYGDTWEVLRKPKYTQRDLDIFKSLAQQSEFYRKASQNANVNPFAPDGE